MNQEREQNYWPGFVDALSNVVLTLVFVIVVFVFALVASANKVEQAAKEAASAQAQIEAQKKADSSASESSSDLAKDNQALRGQLVEMQKELGKLQAEGALGAATATNTAQTKEVDINVTDQPKQKEQLKTIGIQAAGDKITINYPLAVADLDDKSTAALDKLLDDFKPRFGGEKITIRSMQGSEPFSAAQRYAYYRAISIRNHLLAKNISDSRAISSLIAQPQAAENGRVEVIFGP